MKPLFAALLASAALSAAAQTPAPATTPPAAEAPKPRAPLKLQLDEKDMRSLMTLTPTDGERKEDASLPTLGGNAAPVLERKISDVVPKDQTPGK
jgi:hypothetical protein